MLRVCVIGMGPIGNRHAKIYTENPDVTLVGVCDRIRERAEKAGSLYGVPYFTDAEEMLSSLSPDLVSIATGGYEYSSDHYEPTMQAISHGCHILGEKPICNDMDKAHEMVSTAKAKGVCYAIDLNHRFTPAAYEAKKWQDEGRLGTPLFCNMSLWIGKFGEFESPYYHLKALNPHSVDIMRHFCGEVKSVQCFAIKAPGRNIWSSASTNMLFENSAVGNLISSYDLARSHNVEKFEITGTEGRILIEDMWMRSMLYPAGSMVRLEYKNPVFDGYADFVDTFRGRINAYVKQLLSGITPDEVDGSGESGYRSSCVIHAAIKSLQEHRIVDVSEIMRPF